MEAPSIFDRRQMIPRHRTQGKRCHIHRPSKEELSKTTYSDYIRDVVFPAASIDDNTDGAVTPGKIELTEGIAKITFPENFFQFIYGNDITGRGDAWNNTDADFQLETPIQQNLRGLAGVYEYTHRAISPMKLSEFRNRADEYGKAQLGEELFEMTTQMHKEIETHELPLQNIERRFWKRLTPTMPSAIYGADQEGTLFRKDAENRFAISNLDSCLNLLADSIPGVTTPYLYGGMFATVFCAHTEDMNLLSINYLHAGAPKVWYAVSEIHAQRFQSLAEHYYAEESNRCKEFLRHKRNLLSPAVLNRAGIPYVTAIQYPGDAIVTFPGSYHFGFNVGYNVAEATNFAVPEWIPFGEAAKVCLCRPDSVRIHMGRVKELLQIYLYDTVLQDLSYTAWRRAFEEETKQLIADQTRSDDTADQTRSNDVTDVVVGLVAPIATSSATAITTTTAVPQGISSLAEQDPRTDLTVALPPIETTSAIPVAESAASRPKKKAKKQKLSEQQRKKEFWVELTGRPEDWRLAIPILKSNKSKCLSVSRRILLFVSPNDELGLAPSDQQDEACFAGSVVEVADGHVRLHMDGQARKNDVWVPLHKTKEKVFLDGGAWKSDHGIPALHYWVEQDSSSQRLGTTDGGT